MTADRTDVGDEGATRLLDLVAAVDYLRRGIRPGITVWDAIEEALHSDSSNERDETEVGPPRASTVERLAAGSEDTMIDIQAAIGRWLATMADRYNDGYHWPHPTARRGFPPTQLEVNDE